MTLAPVTFPLDSGAGRHYFLLYIKMIIFPRQCIYRCLQNADEYTRHWFAPRRLEIADATGLLSLVYSHGYEIAFAKPVSVWFSFRLARVRQLPRGAAWRLSMQEMIRVRELRSG